MIKSLKNQLVIALCALAGVVGAIQAFSSYQLTRAGTSAVLDLRLEQTANRLRSAIGDAIPTNPARGDQPPRDIAVTIWRDDLEIPYRTTEPALELPRDAPSGFLSTEVNGESWRIYTLRDPPKVIQVAQRSSVRHEIAETNALNTIWPTVILVPLVWIAVILVVKRSLRRLTDLGKQVQSLDASHLESLGTGGVPIELLPFIESINQLIERLGRSIETERKFISDAAHELRTPLTALQLQADNLQPHIVASNQERFQELRKGIARSSGLIVQLLRLARADAPLPAEVVTRVDVAEVVVTAVSEVLPIAIERGIDIGAEEEMTRACVQAVEADVSIAVRNLVSNAIRYTPDGGKVDLRTLVRDGLAWVEVIDTGPGIDEALLPRVFDRFFRANTTIEGSGLGLAIVKAIATKYGGETALRNRGDGQSGIVAAVGFPLAA
jgi:two-component system OmpR family sensor kinase